MTHVLFMRHGQSEANVLNVFAGGETDSKLTEEGRMQAKAAAAQLKRPVDVIVASPLSRTRETAEIMAREIGYDTHNIRFDDRLKEYFVGEGEGKSLLGATAATVVGFAGAEDPEHFAHRVRAALDDIRHEKGTVLIVGHGGVAKVIECLRTGKDPKEFYDVPRQQNAAIIELDLAWMD